MWSGQERKEIIVTLFLTKRWEMPDIKTVLREMVIRLAKQEANAKVRPLEKKIIELRESCRSQKKLIVELQKKVSEISRNVKAEEKALTVLPEAMEKIRLFPALIVALRRRLDLSGRQFAKLVGANRHTVSSWESGKSKPQGAHRSKLIALRGIGKTKAKELLGRK
jgi:DNA-binding transcriptional regulator YiaG